MLLGWHDAADFSFPVASPMYVLHPPHPLPPFPPPPVACYLTKAVLMFYRPGRATPDIQVYSDVSSLPSTVNSTPTPQLPFSSLSLEKIVIFIIKLLYFWLQYIRNSILRAVRSHAAAYHVCYLILDLVF